MPIGRRSECDRVIVVKSPYRSLTVTVLPASAEAAEPAADGIGHAHDLEPELDGIAHVDRERLFVADRLQGPSRNHRPVVSGPGELVELPAGGDPDQPLEVRRIDRGEITDGGDSVTGEPLGSPRAYAPQVRDGPRMKKRQLILGAYDEDAGTGNRSGRSTLPAWLPLTPAWPAACSGRSRPNRTTADPSATRRTNRLGDRRARAEQPVAARDIEECLIERNGLDERREDLKDLVKLAAHLAVASVSVRAERRLVDSGAALRPSTSRTGRPLPVPRRSRRRRRRESRSRRRSPEARRASGRREPRPRRRKHPCRRAGRRERRSWCQPDPPERLRVADTDLSASMLGPVAQRARRSSRVASASCEPWQDTASIFRSMVELTSTQTFGCKDPDR